MADNTITGGAAPSVMPLKTAALAEPQPVLSLFDAVALIVGIVVGAGIFSTPSLVAANAGSSQWFIASWLIGGFVSLIGVLCYAELTTTFPNTGGDYHFLVRAFGKKVGFLFAWARMTVIQTGSVAFLAFVFGDYFSQVYNLGLYSSAVYAAAAVVVLTAINIAGVTFGTGAQKLLTTAEVLGLVLVITCGFFFAGDGNTAIPQSDTTSTPRSFGLLMAFVLFTFGGWNEAAYISAELREGKSGRRRMATAFILGIVVITVLYLLANLAYLNALGLAGIAGSQAVGSDVMRIAFGEAGVWLIGIIVAISALTSANATIFTGARTNYALGRDFPVFGFLGRWNPDVSAPVNAFAVQGAIALALVIMGLITRKGFETIIDYTLPVFWFFFLLVGISLFVLRRREPNAERPFRVPLYPITPIVFCLTSTYLLYSSLAYTGIGALVGAGVLIAGALLLAALPALENLLPNSQSRRNEDEISAI